MALIKKPKKSSNKKYIKVRLEQEMIDDITAYCQWAELPSADYFLEHALLFAFKQDKDWNKYKNELRRKQAEKA